VSVDRRGWTDDALALVRALRGWTPAAVDQLGLTWDDLNGRPVQFPVVDATGDRVGTLHYDPTGETEPKMLAEAGSTRELFPPPETIPNDVNELVLGEGEPDPVAAWSAGFTAVGVPGTGGWKREYAGRFSGRRWIVYVIFDCDEGGRRIAAKAARDLAAAGVDVRVVDLDPSRDDGFDLTDFLREHGADALRALLEEAEPCGPPAAAPLADLLDNVRGVVTRYVVLGPFEAVAVALWVVHTWVLSAFDATGYLDVHSPVRRCGKSLLLDLLELLVPRPWKTIEPSEAVFYRRINQSTPTLLLDEVDAIFNKKNEATEGLRACLNAGNKRGTTVSRCVPPKQELAEFEVFCAKALAGIGGLPATITDRSIPIEMRRKQKSDRVERFRSRRARELAAPLTAEIERWAGSVTADVELALHDVETLADEGGPLASLDDRAFEQAWEPLIAVASLAGEDWLEQAIAAAVALSGSRDDELDIGVNLLTDVRSVFDDNLDRVSLATYELLAELLAIEESPWRDWWSDPRGEGLQPSKAAPRRLAQTLRSFGIRPGTVKLPSGTTAKGYSLEAFRDSWARYLVPHEPAHAPSLPSPPSQPSSHAGSVVTDRGRVSVTTGTDPTPPSSGAAQTTRFDAGDRGDGPLEEGRASAEWLARDGIWRSLETKPPLPGEVVDTRHGKPSPDDEEPS
jgi:Protein of unknown function (DUF3631)